MLSVIAATLILQFNPGDMVYLKNDRTKGWLTDRMASIRWNIATTGNEDITAAASSRLVNSPIVYWPKFTKLKVMTTSVIGGETIVRARNESLDQIYWFPADSVGRWNSDVERQQKEAEDWDSRQRQLKAEADRDQEARARHQRNMNSASEKIMPYAVTKTEIAAVKSAVAKGLDPLNMSAQDAKWLSASERKALSSVRQRYRKGG